MATTLIDSGRKPAVLERRHDPRARRSHASSGPCRRVDRRCRSRRGRGPPASSMSRQLSAWSRRWSWSSSSVTSSSPEQPRHRPEDGPGVGPEGARLDQRDGRRRRRDPVRQSTASLMAIGLSPWPRSPGGRRTPSAPSGPGSASATPATRTAAPPRMTSRRTRSGRSACRGRARSAGWPRSRARGSGCPSSPGRRTRRSSG